MTTPTRYTKGVTNVANGTTMGQLIVPDPTSIHMFMEDFNKWHPGDWIITSDHSGATAGNETITDADGGILAFYPANADNDNTFMEWKATDAVETASEIFTFEAGKKLWFKARFKVSDTGDSDFFVGLKSADTTPLTAPVDGVWFQSDDGDDYLDLNAYKASASVLTQTQLYTMADDTYITCGFYYDGTLHMFVNDNEVASVSGFTIPTAALTISFGVQNGSATARTMSVDYICTIKER